MCCAAVLAFLAINDLHRAILLLWTSGRMTSISTRRRRPKHDRGNQWYHVTSASGHVSFSLSISSLFAALSLLLVLKRSYSNLPCSRFRISEWWVDGASVNFLCLVCFHFLYCHAPCPYNSLQVLHQLLWDLEDGHHQVVLPRELAVKSDNGMCHITRIGHFGSLGADLFLLERNYLFLLRWRSAAGGLVLLLPHQSRDRRRATTPECGISTQKTPLVSKCKQAAQIHADIFAVVFAWKIWGRLRIIWGAIPCDILSEIAWLLNDFGVKASEGFGLGHSLPNLELVAA